MYEDFTLLVPTHQRRPHLRQILDYYSTIEAQVLVGDSSAEPVPAADLPDNVRYIHYPGMDFTEKMKRFVKLAETEYAMLCADDDFISPGGIAASLAFLRGHPDYGSAQGRQVSFVHAGQVRFMPIYLHSIGYDLDGETPSARWRTYMAHYVQQYYAVHHTETLQRAFGASPVFKNKNFHELVVNGIHAMAGKHKVLPVFYSAREQPMGSLPQKRISAVIDDPEYWDDVQKFSNAIIRELMAGEGLNLDEGLAVVHAGLMDYIAFDRTWDQGAYSTMEDARERLVRRWKDRDPRRRIGELTESFDEIAKLGNPMDDEQANREVQRIAEIVARHSARPVAV